MGTEEQAEMMEVEGRANENKGKAWGKEGMDGTVNLQREPISSHGSATSQNWE